MNVFKAVELYTLKWLLLYFFLKLELNEAELKKGRGTVILDYLYIRKY